MSPDGIFAHHVRAKKTPMASHRGEPLLKARPLGKGGGDLLPATRQHLLPWPYSGANLGSWAGCPALGQHWNPLRDAAANPLMPRLFCLTQSGEPCCCPLFQHYPCQHSGHDCLAHVSGRGNCQDGHQDDLPARDTECAPDRTSVCCNAISAN